MKKSFLVLAVAILGVLAINKLFAITVNPASAVTADSASTSETVVYRDTSANFAAGTISAKLAATGTSGVTISSSSTGIALAFDGVYTSAQIKSVVGGVGHLALNSTLPAVCISTGSYGWVLPISTSSTQTPVVSCF